MMVAKLGECEEWRERSRREVVNGAVFLFFFLLINVSASDTNTNTKREPLNGSTIIDAVTFLSVCFREDCSISAFAAAKQCMFAFTVAYSRVTYKGKKTGMRVLFFSPPLQCVERCGLWSSLFFFFFSFPFLTYIEESIRHFCKLCDARLCWSDSLKSCVLST